MRRLDERGETLVEVVMALGILSLVLVSSYALATSTFRLGRGAGERTQAVNYLQEQAEALRSYRNNVPWEPSFTGTMGGYVAPGATFCMIKKTIAGNTTWEPTPFSETACKLDNVTVAIHPTSSGTQQYNFDFTASWKTGFQNNNVTLTTTLTDQTP